MDNAYKAIIVAADTIYAPTDCYRMFRNMSNLLSFNSKNFKVDDVVRMQNMFSGCSKLENIYSLSQWRVTKVLNLSSMFKNCSNLINSSVINDWDINRTANFTDMFNGAPSHPEFTKVSGTWDANGTFTPTVNNS